MSNQSYESIYIHWPFCPYKCHFCPFVALAGHDHYMEQYHQALCREITAYAQALDKKTILNTIFFGGGTPSTYPDQLLLDTFGILKRIWHITDQTEVTIEVNPGTVRESQLGLWRDLGINRISIGVQSTKDSALKKLNRHQTAAQVMQVLDQACQVFDNISVDLILGLPEVSQDEWKELLAQVVTWPISHVSVYFLTVHEDTPLYFKVKTQKVTLMADDALVDLYYWTIDFLARAGFEHYEISNFARNGAYSRHNWMYWQRTPYRGFGLGAWSFDGTHRFQNEKNLLRYIQNSADDSVRVFSETLKPEQIHMEKVMLGLRKREGVARAEIMQNIKKEDARALDEQIKLLITNEWLQEREGRLSLTPKGLSVENEIAVRLSL